MIKSFAILAAGLAGGYYLCLYRANRSQALTACADCSTADNQPGVSPLSVGLPDDVPGDCQACGEV